MARQKGGGPACEISVEVRDCFPEIVTTASAPNNHAPKSLLGQRLEDRVHDRFMEAAWQVDESRTVVSVLWSGAEGHRGQNYGPNVELSFGSFGCREAQLLTEPSIEVNWEMRSLLLGAASGYHRQPPPGACLSKLFIRKVAVPHSYDP